MDDKLDIKKILLIAGLYLTFYLLGTGIRGINSNNYFYAGIGQFLMGIANLSLGIIGLKSTKEKRIWPIYLYFVILGIAQIAMSIKIFFF
jgi:hypothetical protein